MVPHWRKQLAVIETLSRLNKERDYRSQNSFSAVYEIRVPGLPDPEPVVHIDHVWREMRNNVEYPIKLQREETIQVLRDLQRRGLGRLSPGLPSLPLGDRQSPKELSLFYYDPTKLTEGRREILEELRHDELRKSIRPKKRGQRKIPQLILMANADLVRTDEVNKSKKRVCALAEGNIRHFVLRILVQQKQPVKIPDLMSLVQQQIPEAIISRRTIHRAVGELRPRIEKELGVRDIDYLPEGKPKTGYEAKNIRLPEE